jgi:hypothetical protein
MINCPGCGAATEGLHCTYCGLDLNQARWDALFKQSTPKPLPVYREGEQSDVENLKKLAQFVAWTDLNFQEHYVLSTTIHDEDGVRIEGFDGTRDSSEELVEIADLPWETLKLTRPLDGRSCVVHYLTATMNAYGKTVEGILMEDGWHGAIAEFIDIANKTVQEKAARLQSHPELQGQPLYPKSMWR